MNRRVKKGNRKVNAHMCMYIRGSETIVLSFRRNLQVPPKLYQTKRLKSITKVLHISSNFHCRTFNNVTFVNYRLICDQLTVKCFTFLVVLQHFRIFNKKPQSVIHYMYDFCMYIHVYTCIMYIITFLLCGNFKIVSKLFQLLQKM